MPLRVHSYFAYFTPEFGGPTWDDVKAQHRQDIYHATKFVKAIKGEPVSGFADLVLPGVGAVRLDDSTRHHAVDWFAAMAATKYTGKDVERLHLVPAPGSSCTTPEQVMAGVPGQLCSAIARHLSTPCVVQPLLWWHHPMVSARKGGGTRDAGVKHLMLNEPVIAPGAVGPGQVWVLVDDNISTGGTLRAMAKRLREAGVAVALGLCVSHTVHAIEDGIAHKLQELPDL